MITVSNAVVPSINPVGLQLAIGSCSFYINGSLIASPPTTIVLPSNATSYVYLSLPTGMIGVASAGFPQAGAIPIALATTDNAGVISLVDQRPDFFNNTPASNNAISTSASISIVSPAAATTYVFAIAGFGGITITLPSAAISLGGSVVVKKVDAAIGAVTVLPTNSQTLEGQASYTLTNQYQYLGVTSDGSNWDVCVSN